MSQLPPSRTRVLVCFAVAEEARYFTPPAGPETEVLLTGVGARSATRRLLSEIAQSPPDLVITSGFAGGLRADHSLGRVIYDDEHAGPYRAALSGLPLFKGRFAHSDRVLISPAEKAICRDHSGADAVEMESSAIVAVCRDRHIPVLVLRVISDEANEALPMDFNRFTREDGGMNLGPLLVGIASRPAVIPRLMRFRRRLVHASRSLAQTLHQVLARPPISVESGRLTAERAD